MLHYMVHVTPLCCALDALGRMTSTVTDVRLTHHALVEKVRTRLSVIVRTSTSLIQSLGTLLGNVVAKVRNCIPRSHIVYIDTTGFLFMV